MEKFEEKMKILVTFYSRHGHTKKVGEKIAKILGADIEEIIDKKDRNRLVSWFASAFDEELRTPTKILPLKKNPSNYNLVIIGTPIWSGIAPPIETYLSKNKFKKVAFFATFGASAENAFYIMEKLSKKPLAILELQDRQIEIGEHKKLIKNFCRTIKKLY